MDMQLKLEKLTTEVEGLKKQITSERLEKMKWIFFSKHTNDYNLLLQLVLREPGNDTEVKINKVIEILNKTQDSNYPNTIFEILKQSKQYQEIIYSLPVNRDYTIFSCFAIEEAILQYNEKHIGQEIPEFYPLSAIE